MARQVIFVAARNPNTPGGGHDTYVRAHARAAVRAGFEPHIFCRGSRAGVEETDFGIVHQVALPFCRRFLQTRAKRLYYSQIASLTQFTMKLDAPDSSTRSRSFVRANSGPHLVHGIGVGLTSALPFKNAFGRLTSKSLLSAAFTAVPLITATVSSAA